MENNEYYSVPGDLISLRHLGYKCWDSYSVRDAQTALKCVEDMQVLVARLRNDISSMNSPKVETSEPKEAEVPEHVSEQAKHAMEDLMKRAEEHRLALLAEDFQTKVKQQAA